MISWLNNKRAKGKLAGMALMWVGFMIFFTYTDVIMAFIKVTVDSVDCYSANQCRQIAMFVNFGLVAMLAFDYGSTDKPLRSKDFILPFISIALSIIILGHSYLVNTDRYQNYIYPLNIKEFGLYIHGLFILSLFKLKYNVLCAGIPEQNILGTVK